MKVIRTPAGGRGLAIPKREGLVVEVPRSTRRELALLPLGTFVKARCMQIDADAVQVQSIGDVEQPAAVTTAIARFHEDKPRTALAALMSEGARVVEDDPHRLGWRIRLELDLEQEQEAARDFRLLLGVEDKLDIGDSPPGLLNLWRSLSPDLQDELSPELVQRVTRFNYQSPEVGRLLDMIPVEQWPCGYLAYRLKADLTGSIAENSRREAQRRLEGEPELDERDRERLTKSLARADELRAERARREEQRRSQKAQVHPVLRKAVHLVTREARPPRPYHAGGPPPRLSWEQRQDLERWITDETRRRTKRSLRQRESRYRRDETKALVGRAVELVMEKEPDDAVRAFLLELDQTMMRIELAARAARAQPAPAAGELVKRLEAITPRILYRGVDERGRVQAWLLGVGQGYGLFCQIKGAWIWVEGTFDEVVASMPDHWFEGAATAMAALE
jgi:hypothetical protein